ncbi:MAG: hypothetical protein ACFFCM_04915, partial [Promethearchaeota archaeon]
MKNKGLKTGLVLIITTLLFVNFINISSFMSFDATIPSNLIYTPVILDQVQIPDDIYNIELPDDLPKLQTAVGNEPNLTRIGYPLIIRMGDQPLVYAALQGLNESYIRVLYYNATNHWVEVPFQIDEKG